MAIARSLVKDPKVLLADEPTGNLDEGTRDDIMGLLEKLWRDNGLTLILVTHDTAVTCPIPTTAACNQDGAPGGVASARGKSPARPVHGGCRDHV